MTSLVKMQTWLWLSLMAIAVTSQDALEDRCACSQGDEIDCICGPGYEIKGRKFNYVDIECEGTKLNCSTFPRIKFARNSTLSSFSIWKCGIEEPISCFLAKMDVKDVEKITLRSLRTPLRGVHFEGLQAPVALRMYDMDVQKEFPYDVIMALPKLRDFRLNSASVVLKSDGFKGPELRFLELSSDGIEQLPPSSFSGLEQLDYLGVWRNNITDFHIGSFQGLANLSRLCLDNNLASTLPVGVLSHTPQLVSFIMKNNPLTYLPDGLFHGLGRLENITISSKQTLKLDPYVFTNLTALRMLKLEWSHIEDLPKTLFQGSRSIQELSLKGNKIWHLHAELFRDQAKLYKLDLSKNNLTNITGDVFTPLKNLLNLDLSHNRIDVLTDYLFSGLPKLRILAIANNGLKQIDPKAFSGAPLHSLDLSSNRLTFESDQGYSNQYGSLESWCPFDTLTELMRLNLKHNSINFMCEYWKTVMTHLQILDLSYNNFTELTYADAIFVSDHLKVDLSHNHIEKIFMNPLLWSEVASTATVVLNYNPFICDCNLYPFMKVAKEYHDNFELTGSACAEPAALKGHELNGLSLDKFVCELDECSPKCTCIVRPAANKLEANCTEIHSKVFNVSEYYHDMVKAVKLDRAPVTLKHMPFENVAELDLSGLNLKEVPYEDLPKSVKFLNLSNNDLEYLPIDLLDRDMEFALSGNRITCDCSHRKYMYALVQNIPKIRDAKIIECQDGRLLSVIDATSLCDVWLASFIGTTLTVLGVFCIIFAAIIYKYSFEVKIYISKYLPCLLPEEKYDASKRYDVFISYAHQDEDFVRDLLLPKLEGNPHNFKICVHFRDWLAGETIPYNIAKSVEDSRRTVIILSENFLGSIWGLLEFRAAHVQAAREGRARVIIILLEDVTAKKNLDREIDAYLNTNTYLKWGEPWFWEKLVYALPRRGHIVNNSEERRLHSVAERLVKSGLDVQLSAGGQLINAAYIKDV